MFSVEILERPEEEIKLLIYHLNENISCISLLGLIFISHPLTPISAFCIISASIYSLYMAVPVQASRRHTSPDFIALDERQYSSSQERDIVDPTRRRFTKICYLIWRLTFKRHPYLTSETKRNADLNAEVLNWSEHIT